MRGTALLHSSAVYGVARELSPGRHLFTAAAACPAYYKVKISSGQLAHRRSCSVPCGSFYRIALLSKTLQRPGHREMSYPNSVITVQCPLLSRKIAYAISITEKTYSTDCRYDTWSFLQHPLRSFALRRFLKLVAVL